MHLRASSRSGCAFLLLTLCAEQHSAGAALMAQGSRHEKQQDHYQRCDEKIM
jgi:hypothetical protein